MSFKHAKQIYTAASENRAADVRTAFKSSIRQHINERIAQRKVEIAEHLFQEDARDVGKEQKRQDREKD